MIYREIDGTKVSCLGMGNMRLPTMKDDPAAEIDFIRASEIIDLAMQEGVNYYDTAYVYHNGKSEKFIGEALKKYPRDSFYIATKFLIGANPDYKAVFEQQLENLQTDYVDFYLIHAVMDSNIEEYLSCGCIDYFLEQKAKGRIKKLGFSSHSSPDGLRRFADHHEWDFAQIQLNYLDWLYSSAKEEYEILTERNIPIIVMESVRGGKLANLNESLNAKLKEKHPNWSIASWAFRWLKCLPNVHVMLSGMSNLEQIQDNLDTFSTEAALSSEEVIFIENIAREFKTSFTIPCTACRYCCDDCPKGLALPRLLEIYNAYRYGGWWSGHELNEFEADKLPGECIGCAKCQDHCPQGIDIPGIMKEMSGLGKGK